MIFSNKGRWYQLIHLCRQPKSPYPQLYALLLTPKVEVKWTFIVLVVLYILDTPPVLDFSLSCIIFFFIVPNSIAFFPHIGHYTYKAQDMQLYHGWTSSGVHNRIHYTSFVVHHASSGVLVHYNQVGLSEKKMCHDAVIWPWLCRYLLRMCRLYIDEDFISSFHWKSFGPAIWVLESVSWFLLTYVIVLVVW